MNVPATIFRQYDIRGTTGDQLTPALARAVGAAYATFARARLGRPVVVALGPPLIYIFHSFGGAL